MTRDELKAALQNVNVAAFLRVIRAGESSQDDSAYTIQFGGSHFDAPPWNHPQKVIAVGRMNSSAAGAYQFLTSTWQALQRQYGFEDFSPSCQDQAAIALIAGRKALDDVIAGRLTDALTKCGKEWASLPGSPYGQPTLTLDKARALFINFGGTIDLAAPEKLAAVPQEKTSMPLALLIQVFGPAIASMIPQVAKLFDQSPVAQRNTQAAEAVINTITSVAKSPDLPTALDAMKADPVLAQSVTQAVVTHPDVIGIIEIGGGVAKAREAAIAVENADKSFIHNPAFWISLVLIAMPFMLLVDVFYVHPAQYDGNLRTQIVTGVLLVISMVAAFWLGSSSGSQAKDKTIQDQATLKG